MMDRDLLTQTKPNNWKDMHFATSNMHVYSQGCVLQAINRYAYSVPSNFYNL